MNQRRFTLIELLVVITIIMILAAMLLPTIEKARAKALTATCASNLKQVALAMRMYADDWEGYLPPDSGGTENAALVNNPDVWMKLVEQDVGDRATLLCPMVSGVNVYSNGGTKLDPPTDYSAGAKVLGKLLSSINNSSSVLLMFERQRDKNNLSEAYGDINWRRTSEMTTLTRHNGGVNAACVDGHVEWARWNVYGDTRASGKPIYTNP